MERLYTLAVLVLAISPAFSAVGAHNFVIKAGGGLSASTTQPLEYLDGKKRPEVEIQQETTTFVGGVIAVDLGYQFFGTKNSVVQGVDALIGFGMNFDTMLTIAERKLPPGLGARLDIPYGYISSTYSVGRQFDNAKLMFDILGINLAIGNMTLHSSEYDEYHSTEAGGVFHVGINLPIGTQYIMNNGFVIGFRHSLNFLFPAYNNKDGDNFLNEKVNNKTLRAINYINYNLIVSFGYMFGK
ncbi:hypothetical protein SAMN02745150_00946 [Brevinema andersonii]|uniref:Outer membrane protein beta-barrel domain-containing protein n=1 Tax=Brevinema andersonii TaxID=34097 RepID=A0A1I1E4Q1_BREAD|nr:hypothetical protein [Brevinema andersonii]SFB82141.1 hypothetical protein SAMN02745150_00946 [Brevinema andersonii]